MTQFSLISGRSRTASSWPVLLLSTTLFVWLTGCQSMFVLPQDRQRAWPEKHENELAAIAYQEILQSVPKSQNAHLSQMVERIGQRIAAVSERPDYLWEFTLLSGESQDAFCLPGGKVAVYEGLLPVCANEAGLAVVMSHEIAHALQRHGSQRLTQQLDADEAEWNLGRLFQHRSAQKVEMVKNAYGLESKSGVLLPFTREQESQADSRGMLLMARAGYDPQEAPRFWDRINQALKSPAPQLLSAHPADENRSTKLNEILPWAMSVYQSAPQRHGLGEQIPMSAFAELALKPKPVVSAKELLPTSSAATPPAATAAIVAPVPAPPQPSASVATGIAAVSIAPAPIVQTVPAATTVGQVSGSPPAPALDTPLQNLGAPTVIGPHELSTTPPIVTAAAEATTSIATVVPAEVGALPAVSVEKTAAEQSAPPTLDESSDWKPHVE